MLTRGSWARSQKNLERRHRRSAARPLLLAVGSAVTLLSSTAPAAADGWGSVDCGQAPSPQCELQVGGGTSTPPSRGTGHEAAAPAEGDEDAGGGEQGNCGYRPSEYEAPVGAAGSGLFPSTVWYEGLCSTTGVITNPVPVQALTPAAVASLARGQLSLLQPDIAASPATDQLVNLPTWLWLDRGWNDVTATASVPGVSVTATARPSTVTWSMGDGEVVTCAGAGTPFRRGADPHSSSPDCGHTYYRSSVGQPGDAFVASATVHWSVRWSGAGQAGTFPDLTTTGSTRFRVAESQALNVRPAR